MGLMDKLKEMLGRNTGKVEQGVDKAGSLLDEKTGGKYSDQVKSGEEAVKKGLHEQGQ
jgi:hypothetical protein